MRTFLVATGIAAFAVVASAQEVFQCVNPNVMNSLVFNARSESKLVVKRAMPDSVAGFGAPAEFTLIGSGVRGQGLSTVVAYKTALEGAKAFDNLLASLSAEGWRREATPQEQQPKVSVAGSSPLAATLCREGERRNLLVQEIGGVRYATISSFATTPRRACNAPIPRQDFPSDLVSLINAVHANLPQFSFPETAHVVFGPNGRETSISSSDNTFTTTRIESPDTASSLADQLGRQLTTQGWRSDAEWKGTLSTGSTWMRRADDGQAYWGTLEILSINDGIYDVGFSVNSRR